MFYPVINLAAHVSIFTDTYFILSFKLFCHDSSYPWSKSHSVSLFLMRENFYLRICGAVIRVEFNDVMRRVMDMWLCFWPIRLQDIDMWLRIWPFRLQSWIWDFEYDQSDCRT